MGDVSARASSVNVSGKYGTSAEFIIPDDARSFYPIVSAGGRVSNPEGSYDFVYLSPKNFEYVSGVKGISYAPTTGKVWIAGSGTLFELDLFKRVPEQGIIISNFSNPLISRVTDDGRIFVVERANGASEIFQIDVSSGAMTHYAFTTDDSFTRAINPKGIAADPDGSACFIADGNNGKVVKIPANAGSGSSTIIDNWGNRTFNFGAMIIGIDVNRGHYVVVSSGNGYVYMITSQTYSYSLGYVGSVLSSIEIDRDYSIPTFVYFYYEASYVFANCYNKNPIGDNNPANHGGALFGDLSNGLIELDPNWLFLPNRYFPQKVIMNRENVPYPYPVSYQTNDRIIELEVCGWQNRPVKLKVIDPPDLSAYAPEGGWNPSQSLPYEGNDNVGMSDYGICLTSDCSDGAQAERVVTIGSDWTKKVYLKVPERYSGNNLQVEVIKTDYYGNSLSETKINSATAVYTTYKRVYVERDKMFRRGGLLYSNTAVNDTSVIIYKNPDDTRWDNLSVGDKVAIFDSQNTYEGSHDEAYISEITEIGEQAPHQMKISLVKTKGGSEPYQIKRVYTVSPPNTATHYPDFSQGNSAGVGVVESNDGLIYDSAPNQLNGPGSAFYDADMREIQRSFNDGYVEFLGLRDGMGAVPYLPQSWFDWAFADADGRRGMPACFFSQVWFKNKNPIPLQPHLNYPHNYFHLIGCSFMSGTAGMTVKESDMSLVFRGTIEENCVISCTAEQKANATKETTNHELAHQFGVNSLCNFHCLNNAWCGNYGGECANANYGYEWCIMHPYTDNNQEYWDMRKDGIYRMDCDDLAAEYDGCGLTNCSNGISVRTDEDPE